MGFARSTHLPGPVGFPENREKNREFFETWPVLGLLVLAGAKLRSDVSGLQQIPCSLQNRESLLAEQGTAGVMGNNRKFADVDVFEGLAAPKRARITTLNYNYLIIIVLHGQVNPIRSECGHSRLADSGWGMSPPLRCSPDGAIGSGPSGRPEAGPGGPAR